MTTDMEWKIEMGRDENDPEKALLPALIYATRSQYGVTVKILSLGIWDWSIKLILVTGKPIQL